MLPPAPDLSSRPVLTQFTLTQFRHSYIPDDHIVALAGFLYNLIGGRPKSVLLTGIFIHPPGMMFFQANGPRELDHGTDASRPRIGNRPRKRIPRPTHQVRRL